MEIEIANLLKHGGSMSEAAKLYEQFANQGNAIAQFEIGWCYNNAMGVPHNDILAVMWYGRSAQQRYIPAQRNLGIMFLFGYGVSRSYEYAFDLLYSAVQGNDDEAKYWLGEFYFAGYGVVPIDKSRAVELWKESNHLLATHRLRK